MVNSTAEAAQAFLKFMNTPPYTLATPTGFHAGGWVVNQGRVVPNVMNQSCVL